MEATDFIIKYKNKILNIAIIILAVIIANNTYKKQANIIASLKQNKDTEIKKNEALGSIGQLEKKMNAYKNSLIKKDNSLIMSAINDIAKDSGIKITSFRPEPEILYAVYVKYSYSLSINAKDYNSVGKFISKIENSPDIYTVDSVNIRPLPQGQGEVKEEETYKIAVELILSTVWFKG
jgi:Tfp pilus assembly protein PilO